MMPSRPSICHLCEHYMPGMHPANTRMKPVCRAFPEGIPDDMIYDGYDHREPLFDETVLFKLSSKKTLEDLTAWEGEILEIEKEEFLDMVDQMNREGRYRETD